jgi:hypothetical protein
LDVLVIQQAVAESFEDDRSISKHITQLQEEMRKRNPDLHLVNDKMRRTVAFRQKFCHENNVQDIMSKFPCLQRPSLVSNKY